MLTNWRQYQISGISEVHSLMPQNPGILSVNLEITRAGLGTLIFRPVCRITADEW